MKKGSFISYGAHLELNYMPNIWLNFLISNKQADRRAARYKFLKHKRTVIILSYTVIGDDR